MERNHVLHGRKCRDVRRLVNFGALLMDEYPHAQDKLVVPVASKLLSEGNWTPTIVGLFKLNVDASRYP